MQEMINKQQTMTSSQLAELLNYDKKEINKKVRLMFSDVKARELFSPDCDTQNRVIEYYLPELESKMFVAKHDITYLEKITQYWINQESKPLSLEDMTLLVIEGQKEKIAELELKIESDKPATDFGIAISQSAGTCKIGDWVKAINDSGDIAIGRNKAFKLLRDKGYLLKDNTPMQRYVDGGLFELKEGMIVTDIRTIQTFTTLLTGKGQMVLARKFKQWLGGFDNK